MAFNSMVILGSGLSKFVNGNNFVVDGGFSNAKAEFCIFDKPL